MFALYKVRYFIENTSRHFGYARKYMIEFTLAVFPLCVISTPGFSKARTQSIHEQNENINQEIETIQRKQKFLELKNQ